MVKIDQTPSPCHQEKRSSHGFLLRFAVLAPAKTGISPHVGRVGETGPKGRKRYPILHVPGGKNANVYLTCAGSVPLYSKPPRYPSPLVRAAADGSSLGPGEPENGGRLWPAAVWSGQPA